jgi:polar amino acid transport system substrate-binding protein
VVVGAVSIDVPRTVYFEKELEVRLSRSYGPGRYDPSYEEKGNDYPPGYVRWTEGRNLGEFVRLLGSGAVRLEPLITHRFPFDEAPQAYETLTGEAAGGALGVVLEYPESLAPEPRRHAHVAAGGKPAGDKVGVGFIGAGNFAMATLIPTLASLGAGLRGVVTASGVSARNAAEKFGFAYTAAEPDALFDDDEVHAVFIATRHADHAELAARALRAGKAVFVEKPLALTQEGLEAVLEAAGGAGPLMVGFNRRFAPATTAVRDGLAGVAGARVVLLRVNAGEVPADSWVHDPEVGGGRLIGEGCHFIDLGLFLAGSPPVDVAALALGAGDPAARLGDNLQVTVRCRDGSLVVVVYTSKGDPRTGKERVEVFAGGRTAVIDDFRRAEVSGGGRWKGRQDKGHEEELRLFLEAVRSGGPAPIPLSEIEASMRATLRAADAVRAAGAPVALAGGAAVATGG